jgi:LuxR family maltose regulon positive regulatory protein
MFRGNPQEARELLERCAANLPASDWGMLALTTTYHAQACLAVGDVEAAENDARRADEMAAHGRMPPWWPSLLAALQATLLAGTGRIDEALARLEQPTDGPEYYLAICYKANVLLRGDRPEKTIEVLENYPADRMYPHVASLVDALRAQALLETGDRTGAHDALERALVSAHKFNFVGPFLLIGRRISPLLEEHLDQGTSHPDFVVQVRNRLSTPPSQSVNEWGEQLTQREQSILRYLATDLSHAEIAEAEFISVNTVKTHTAHLYQKLGVANRRAAVRRSAQLGLIRGAPPDLIRQG